MRYIVKQKLNIADLVNIKQQNHKILLYEPEDFLAGLYLKHLIGGDFEVKHSPVLELLYGHIKEFNPKVIIFNLDTSIDINTKINWLKNFKKESPEVYIITTGFNTTSEILRIILGLGISSHINRRLSRPQDIVVLAKTLLKN